MIDGFYVGYFSTRSGYGVVLFVFQNNIIVGVDAGGVKFDGKFEENKQSGVISGEVTITAPPNIELVQGVNTGHDGLTYTVPFTIPNDFLSEPFLGLNTPFGPVNIRLEKLRDLGS